MRSWWIPWLAVIASASCLPARGQAQDVSEASVPAEVRVSYALADETWIDRAVLARRALELAGVTLVEGEAAPEAWWLVIEMPEPEAARVTLHRAGSDPIERQVAVPDHLAERTEALAIVAANLLRDESAELLALLAPPPAETTPEPAETLEPPVETTAPVETADPSAELGNPVAPDRPPGPPWLRLGLAAHLTSVPAGGGTEADVFYGVEIAWTAPELLAVGVRDIAAGGLPGRDGAHIDASPFAELAWTLDFFSLYGQVGAHLQVIIEQADGDAHMGVAAFADVGARFRLDPVFSLGIETMLRLVATEELSTSAHQLPQLSLPWSAGITAQFHIR